MSDELIHMRRHPSAREFIKKLPEGLASEACYIAGAVDYEAWSKQQLVERRRCKRCNDPAHEQYMLKDDVWLKVFTSKDGHCHLECFEYLLGRQLTLNDLVATLPINAPYFIFGRK